MWERFNLLLARLSVADLRREEGQTTVEYTLMILVAAVLAGIILAWAKTDGGFLKSIENAITTAVSGITG